MRVEAGARRLQIGGRRHGGDRAVGLEGRDARRERDGRSARLAAGRALGAASAGGEGQRQGTGQRDSSRGLHGVPVLQPSGHINHTLSQFLSLEGHARQRPTVGSEAGDGSFALRGFAALGRAEAAPSPASSRGRGGGSLPRGFAARPGGGAWEALKGRSRIFCALLLHGRDQPFAVDLDPVEAHFPGGWPPRARVARKRRRSLSLRLGRFLRGHGAFILPATLGARQWVRRSPGIFQRFAIPGSGRIERIGTSFRWAG